MLQTDTSTPSKLSNSVLAIFKIILKKTPEKKQNQRKKRVTKPDCYILSKKIKKKKKLPLRRGMTTNEAMERKIFEVMGVKSQRTLPYFPY